MKHPHAPLTGLLMLPLLTAATLAQADTLNLKWTELRRSTITASDAAMEVVAINDNGQAAGRTWRTSKVYNSTTRSWIDSTVYTATRWSAAGLPTTLASSGQAVVNDLGADGTVVGADQGSAVVWKATTATTLGAPAGSKAQSVNAQAINASGQIVGTISADNALGTMKQRHAATWTSQGMTDLHGSLPVPSINTESMAVGIGADGTIGVHLLSDALGSSTGTTCYILKDGTVTSLKQSGAIACQIGTMARDGSALTQQISIRPCTPEERISGLCYPQTYASAWWHQGTLTPVAYGLQLLRSGLLFKVDTSGVSRVNGDGSSTPMQFNVTGLPTGFSVTKFVDSNAKGQYLVQLTRDSGSVRLVRWGVLSPR